MSALVAIDVAILPPPEVSAQAVALSAALGDDPEGLRLDDEHLPHVTLTQQFVRAEEIDQACALVAGVLAGRPPLTLHVTGSGHGGSSLWMVIERSAELLALHSDLMEALRGVERPDGGPGAFAEDARVKDVLWVAGFRLQSSLGRYAPHITLGHGQQPPHVEPFTFEAADVAVCHLGRFCTCRRVLARWTLTGGSGR